MIIHQQGLCMSGYYVTQKGKANHLYHIEGCVSVVIIICNEPGCDKWSVLASMWRYQHDDI